MKTTLFAFGLILISQTAHTQQQLAVRALNCGVNTSNLERDLTTGDRQAGVSGTQESLDELAQSWIKTEQFPNLSGRIAVLLKPYTVISKIGSQNKMCVIYEGTVVESKILQE